MIASLDSSQFGPPEPPKQPRKAVDAEEAASRDLSRGGGRVPHSLDFNLDQAKRRRLEHFLARQRNEVIYRRAMRRAKVAESPQVITRNG